MDPIINKICVVTTTRIDIDVVVFFAGFALNCVECSKILRAIKELVNDGSSIIHLVNINLITFIYISFVFNFVLCFKRKTMAFKVNT